MSLSCLATADQGHAIHIWIKVMSAVADFMY